MVVIAAELPTLYLGACCVHSSLALDVSWTTAINTHVPLTAFVASALRYRFAVLFWEQGRFPIFLSLEKEDVVDLYLFWLAVDLLTLNINVYCLSFINLYLIFILSLQKAFKNNLRTHKWYCNGIWCAVKVTYDIPITITNATDQLHV